MFQLKQKGCKMDIERLQQLAGNSPEEGGNTEMFKNSLTTVFGLTPETVAQVVAQVQRSGDTRMVSDQQVRQRIGTRAAALLQQAIDAVGSDEEMSDDQDMEAEPVGDGMEDEMADEMADDEAMPDEGAMDVENTDERR